MTISQTVRCSECDGEISPRPGKDLKPGTSCDDCFFERFGDLLSIEEQARAELKRPENRRIREEQLGVYHHWLLTGEYPAMPEFDPGDDDLLPGP